MTARRGEHEQWLERDVELGGVPRDSHAFALTLAADELLVAALDGLSEQEERAPFEPKRATDERASSSAAPEAPPRPKPALGGWRAGARVAFERFAGGQRHFGADGLLRLTIAPRLTLDLAFGARRGSSVSSSNGEVTSRALSAGGGLRYALVTEPLAAGLGLGVQGDWVRFEGRATLPATRENDHAGLACYAQLLAFTSLRLGGPAWLDVAAASGLPLRAQEAADTGRRATGVSGLQLALFMALSFEL